MGATYRALKRYKWLIAVIVLIGTIGGVVATRFIKPTYQVDTTIVVGESPDPKGPVRPQVRAATRQAWGELLKSFAILDPVARQIGMYVTPKSDADSLLLRDFQPTSDLQTGDYILTINIARRKSTISPSSAAAPSQSSKAGAARRLYRSHRRISRGCRRQLCSSTRQSVKFEVRDASRGRERSP